MRIMSTIEEAEESEQIGDLKGAVSLASMLVVESTTEEAMTASTEFSVAEEQGEVESIQD